MYLKKNTSILLIREMGFLSLASLGGTYENYLRGCREPHPNYQNMSTPRIYRRREV